MTHISHPPIIDRQAMYLLRDPNNTLNKYKKRMFMRNELLLVQKAKLRPYDIVYHKGK